MLKYISYWAHMWSWILSVTCSGTSCTILSHWDNPNLLRQAIIALSTCKLPSLSSCVCYLSFKQSRCKHWSIVRLQSAIPEHLTGVFIMRHYTDPHSLLPYLTTTVRLSHYNVPYLSTLQVCSWWGTIQIHVHFYLTLQQLSDCHITMCHTWAP